jgi:hypothetical protein
MNGYTPREAERVKHTIDINTAKAEDAVTRMRGLVSDHSVYFEDALDRIREGAGALKDIIDRRTQR